MNDIEGTKINIITNTIDLVAQIGLGETTIHKIAQSAHVSEGALYKHFKSKNVLLAACFNHIEHLLHAAVRKQNIDTTAVVGVLKTAWDSYINYWFNNDNSLIFYEEYRHSNNYIACIKSDNRKLHNYYNTFIMANIIKVSQCREYDQYSLESIITQMSLSAVLLVRQNYIQDDKTISDELFSILLGILQVRSNELHNNRTLCTTLNL